MKYKLIKTFPGSVELGTIVSDDEIKSETHLVAHTGVGQYTAIPKEHIENYPEFWEEVKEKEYTILSFINSSGDLFNIDENGGYRYKTWSENVTSLSLEKCLDGQSLKIHSVRREKDGEIFTLGDKVFFPSDRDNIKEIEAITINNAFISKLSVSVGGIEKWGMNNLRKAPIRKPILITEDGVEIFEGDKCWYVNSDFLYGKIFMDAENHEERKSHCKFFSTLEKAEEYIKWNKPMYSLNDVNNATFGNHEVIEYLQELDRK